MTKVYKPVILPKCVVCGRIANQSELRPYGTRHVHLGPCSTLLRKTLSRS